MGEPVVPPKPTVDSIRARVLVEHRYVTRQVDVEGAVAGACVIVCECGVASGDQPLYGSDVMAFVDAHLNDKIRQAFEHTEFAGQRGTARLRGFERHVHDSLR